MIPNKQTSFSEADTQALGAELAEELHGRGPRERFAFVELEGALGAGKTEFARGFIKRWAKLSGDAEPDSITSPTYNIVKVYGVRAPLAHLDLYRVKSLQELEQIGFEHYFFEHSCCIVEWLSQIPEAHAIRPARSISVKINFIDNVTKAREIAIQELGD